MENNRIHIRRTDKVGTEAKSYPVSQYMENAEKWFVEYEKKHGVLKQRTIYLATDEPDVLKEARNL